MPSYRYLHLDVFTDRRFQGNQLAVFPDARGLDLATMQAFANEMNFVESTFLLPAEDPDTDIRMRIFTPGIEMPMAGHPTIGSTYALAHTGAIAGGRDRWVFGLNVGPTPVELDWRGSQLHFAWMDQRQPEFRRPAVSSAKVIRAVGLDPAAVAATGLPIEEVSSGAPFLYVPVATRAAVDEAEPDTALMRRLTSAFGGLHLGVFIFSPERGEPDATVYSRMFVPALGLTEDPATGGACGPLGAYLVTHGVVPRDQAGSVVNLQGVKMGRPSRIHVRIALDDTGAPARVQVGGQAVMVGSGEIA